MPTMPAPGWLTAWVKLNTKHVIIPPEQQRERYSKQVDKDEKSKAISQTTCSTAPSTVGVPDPERTAIRRFSGKRHRRRLQKTRSQTDMIRDMAKACGSLSNLHFDDSITTAPRSISPPPPPDTYENVLVPRMKKSLDDRGQQQLSPADSSLHLMAGLFGSDVSVAMGSGPQHQQQQQQQQQRRAQLLLQAAENQNPREDASAKWGRYRRKPSSSSMTMDTSVRSMTIDESVTGDIDLDSSPRPKGSLGSFRFLPHPFRPNPRQENATCSNCLLLERHLATSLDNLEYMRRTAVQSEYICQACEQRAAAAAERQGNSQSPSMVMPMGDNSKQLREVISRHRRQVNQLIQERSDWQREMQVQLDEFASMCKNLNEEVDFREMESAALKRDLEGARSERDEMAGEILRLKAELAALSREKEGHALLRKKVAEYESHGLDGYERAIETRNQTIVELSTKLERALDQLELERNQHRQRRQIIFPGQALS